MIPPFDDNCYLPPGIHVASLDEIDARFGQQSETRQAQMESLRWLVVLAIRVGIARLVVNGSFTTDCLEPNDVDCVLLTGPDFPLDQAALKELESGLPFLQIDLARQVDFDFMVRTVFATDRLSFPKGMVEVIYGPEE